MIHGAPSEPSHGLGTHNGRSPGRQVPAARRSRRLETGTTGRATGLVRCPRIRRTHYEPGDEAPAPRACCRAVVGAVSSRDADRDAVAARSLPDRTVQAAQDTGGAASGLSASGALWESVLGAQQASYEANPEWAVPRSAGMTPSHDVSRRWPQSTSAQSGAGCSTPGRRRPSFRLGGPLGALQDVHSAYSALRGSSGRLHEVDPGERLGGSVRVSPLAGEELPRPVGRAAAVEVHMPFDGLPVTV